MKYTADFETTTDPADCRVWAWAICQIGKPEHVETGISLDSFMRRLSLKRENITAYFHNLKFDGEFILYWLLENGFQHIEDKRELVSRSFTTLITADNKFYEIIVCFYRNGHHHNKAVIRDSLKLLPFSVAKIARDFGLPISKLELDYDTPRPIGHELTEHEMAYLMADVRIMAMALDVTFQEGLTKMTIGANALNSFKKGLDFRNFDKYFPIPTYDAEIRESYFGGYTYVKKGQRGQDQGEGLILDVNSLYPWVMKTKPLPFSEGIPFDGRYQENKLFSLFIQRVRCQFTLKPGKLPTVSDKAFPGIAANYLESSGDEVYCLALTSVDLGLFFEHYDVYNIEFMGGWMFKAKTGLFDSYIDHWIEVKTQAKIEGNDARYTLAKLMLNSLYGKLATGPRVQNRIPTLGEDGLIKYVPGPVMERDPIYIPAASFITAWARYTTITAGQAVYDRFLYADTDSLHLRGLALPEGLLIDPVILGAWKHEYNFQRARYIRPKCYLFYGSPPGKDSYKWVVKAAGLPADCHHQVTWQNFQPRVIYSGKLQAVRVHGGVVLQERSWTIKMI